MDLGIVNLATDSDEHVYSGEKVEHRFMAAPKKGLFDRLLRRTA